MQISVLKKWLSVLLVILGTLVEIGISENLSTNYTRYTYTRISARIRGGNDATLGQWPWMAVLCFWNSEIKIEQKGCSGSVIADEWVLTAAHCVSLPELKLISVRLGDLDVDDKVEDGAHPIDMYIKAVFVHPNFNKTIISDYDITLVQLKEKVTFSKFISPVRLPFSDKFQSNNFYENKKPFIMGWGYQDDINRSKTNHLQYTQVDVENLDDCRRTYANKGINISKEVICAGNYNKTTCRGDSGGPLILLDQNIYYVIGVTSFGGPCGKVHLYHTVFTKVATHLSWIRHVTGISI